MTEVVVVIGPGQIGQAIPRRVGVGKHLLLADRSAQNAEAAAEIPDPSVRDDLAIIPIRRVFKRQR